MTLRTLALSLIPLLVSTALSAADQLPTDADLAAMAERTKRVLAEAERRISAATATTIATPKIDALPSPAAIPAPDIEALAEKLANGSSEAAGNMHPTLLVFVSFSLPKPSLDRLVADAARRGATLVLRGLKDGRIDTTVAEAQRLIGNRKVAWIIDPEAYRRFGVQVVPTHVVVHAGIAPASCGAEQCFGDGDYVRLAGDVTIDYALETIATRAPEFAADVAQLKRSRP